MMHAAVLRPPGYEATCVTALQLACGRLCEPRMTTLFLVLAEHFETPRARWNLFIHHGWQSRRPDWFGVALARGLA